MKPGPQHDQDIWTKFLGGSREAFRDLYEQYADVLYAFGMKYTRDHGLLKDCIHDLFVDLHTYRKTLSPAVNTRYYLLSSLRRKIAASFKRSARIIPASGGPFYFGSAFSLPARRDGADAFIPDGEPFIRSTEDVLVAGEQRQETLQHLAQAIDRLPSRQQEALYLKFNQELTYEETAAIMNVSIATCRTLVYRAITKLRQQLPSQPVYHVLLLI